MRSFYTHKEWIEFDKNYARAVSLGLTTKDKDTGEEILWDTYDMHIKITNDMRLMNGDTNFNRAMNPAMYLAAQLKFVKNEKVLNLLWRFYRYNEYHYDEEIYGQKIIDYCNLCIGSYIIAIFELAKRNKDFKEGCYFYVPVSSLCTIGGKMGSAKLDEDGNLYYAERENFSYTKEELDRIADRYAKEFEKKNAKYILN